jgi:cytochrome P450
VACARWCRTPSSSRDCAPNPHLGFGQGVHYCIGANLARLEIKVMFEELLARFAKFEITGPAVWTRENRLLGLKHLPIRLS